MKSYDGTRRELVQTTAKGLGAAFVPSLTAEECEEVVGALRSAADTSAVV